MLLISIDGATRRNGKPDCVAAGGIFIQRFNSNNECIATDAKSCFEYGSTNQRGELLALLKALEYIHSADTEANIVTDSEYVFNAMTKNWCNRWVANNWRTVMGEKVKNADIWQQIYEAYNKCGEVTFYHIKGHVIPFGKVTAGKLLASDRTGKLLFNEVSNKFDTISTTRLQHLNDAQALSIKNNGFALEPAIFKLFITSNIVADAIATEVVDAADTSS